METPEFGYSKASPFSWVLEDIGTFKIETVGWF